MNFLQQLFTVNVSAFDRPLMQDAKRDRRNISG